MPQPRTDPTLYQWEKLSPAKQRAVMATLGRAGLNRRRWLMRSAISLLLLFALLVVAMLAYVALRGYGLL